jgi:hydroxyacylglutathione hydrolase
VLEVPGHTSTHIAYLGAGTLFCGDTLFAAGCGRVFDGTFEQLAASLERIADLPAATLCYCAHEYTLANLGFAKWVEPTSAAITEREQEALELRKAGQPTVPSRLAEELATNPFLRTGVAEVKAAAEVQAGRPLATSADVFTALRRWKDEKYD